MKKLILIAAMMVSSSLAFARGDTVKKYIYGSELETYLTSVLGLVNGKSPMGTSVIGAAPCQVVSLVEILGSKLNITSPSGTLPFGQPAHIVKKQQYELTITTTDNPINGHLIIVQEISVKGLYLTAQRISENGVAVAKVTAYLAQGTRSEASCAYETAN